VSRTLVRDLLTLAAIVALFTAAAITGSVSVA
jgi:hypothetical protein